LGANNFRDKSLLEKYSYLIGFSQNEINEYFTSDINLYCEKKYVEEELLNIKKFYHGYKFHEDKVENRVYCPFSIIYHIDSMLEKCLSLKQKKKANNKGRYFSFAKIQKIIFLILNSR